MVAIVQIAGSAAGSSFCQAEITGSIAGSVSCEIGGVAAISSTAICEVTPAVRAPIAVVIIDATGNSVPRISRGAVRLAARRRR
jgi:hypothetical protein